MASKALLSELQAAVASYLESHKNLSIQSISNKTGVSYSTIRRILQNEANDVRDETILALILVVMQQPQRLQFLQRYYPALGALLKETRADDVDMDHARLRLYRHKDPHNYILKLSLTAHGTRRQDIDRILGARGCSALDEMVEDKFLVEDGDGRVYHPARGSLLMNAEDILHQIKKDADYFDKALIGSPFARMAHLSASLSQEAYEELIGMINTFLKRCEQLKESPSNQGAVPVFVDLLINTYDRAALTGVSECV